MTLIGCVSWISCYIRPHSRLESVGLRRPNVHASEVLLSPILVRPVREQLEHDRVIRLLQAKYKRKFEVAINPGNEQTAPVGNVDAPWYPDLVLQSNDKGRKLMGTVEVETAESVNNLEAMSQWATFGRLRAPFHLYVPATNIDTTKRLCHDLQIAVAELWAYNALGDQMRFTLIQRASGGDGKSRSAAASPRRPAAAAAPRRATATPAAAPASRKARAAIPPARRTAPAAPVRRKAVAKTKSAPARGAAARKKPSGSRAPKRK